MTPLPVQERLSGVPVHETWFAPRGQMFYAVDPVSGTDRRPTLFMHPSDLMRIKNNGRTPFYTRHMAGVIEGERERRRRARGRR